MREKRQGLYGPLNRVPKDAVASDISTEGSNELEVREMVGELLYKFLGRVNIGIDRDEPLDFNRYLNRIWKQSKERGTWVLYAHSFLGAGLKRELGISDPDELTEYIGKTELGAHTRFTEIQHQCGVKDVPIDYFGKNSKGQQAGQPLMRKRLRKIKVKKNPFSEDYHA